jgi:hypothetical protein
VIKVLTDTDSQLDVDEEEEDEEEEIQEDVNQTSKKVSSC